MYHKIVFIMIFNKVVVISKIADKYDTRNVTFQATEIRGESIFMHVKGIQENNWFTCRQKVFSQQQFLDALAT